VDYNVLENEFKKCSSATQRRHLLVPLFSSLNEADGSTIVRNIQFHKYTICEAIASIYEGRPIILSQPSISVENTQRKLRLVGNRSILKQHFLDEYEKDGDNNVRIEIKEDADENFKRVELISYSSISYSRLYRVWLVQGSFLIDLIRTTFDDGESSLGNARTAMQLFKESLESHFSKTGNCACCKSAYEMVIFDNVKKFCSASTKAQSDLETNLKEKLLSLCELTIFLLQYDQHKSIERQYFDLNCPTTFDAKEKIMASMIEEVHKKALLYHDASKSGCSCKSGYIVQFEETKESPNVYRSTNSDSESNDSADLSGLSEERSHPSKRRKL